MFLAFSCLTLPEIMKNKLMKLEAETAFVQSSDNGYGLAKQ
jgi:hypothetical protein